MKKPKTHVTVTITRRMLNDSYACEAGIRSVAHLLPAMISTDPEWNIDLALVLANLPRATRDAQVDVSWFAAWFVKQSLNLTDGFSPTYRDNAAVPADVDAYVIAQKLAWVADVLASREGC